MWSDVYTRATASISGWVPFTLSQSVEVEFVFGRVAVGVHREILVLCLWRPRASGVIVPNRMEGRSTESLTCIIHERSR